MANLELLVMRLLLALLIYDAFPSSVSFVKQNYAVGLARIFDLTFLADRSQFLFGHTILWNIKHIILPIFLALYVCGVLMKTSLFVIAFALIAYGSLKNSQGAITHNLQILALVPLVQFFAYCRSSLFYMLCAFAFILLSVLFMANGTLVFLIVVFATIINFFIVKLQCVEIKNEKNILQMHRGAYFYTMQAICASYVISALTKLINSRGEWIKESKYFPLQVLKTRKTEEMNSADFKGLDFINAKIFEIMKDNANITRTMMAFGLFLELFAFVALWGRIQSFVIGALLIIFHLLIYKLMGLSFEENILLISIYLMPIAYIISRISLKLLPNKISRIFI